MCLFMAHGVCFPKASLSPLHTCLAGTVQTSTASLLYCTFLKWLTFFFFDRNVKVTPPSFRFSSLALIPLWKQSQETLAQLVCSIGQLHENVLNKKLIFKSKHQDIWQAKPSSGALGGFQEECTELQTTAHCLEEPVCLPDVCSHTLLWVFTNAFRADRVRLTLIESLTKSSPWM